MRIISFALIVIILILSNAFAEEGKETVDLSEEDLEVIQNLEILEDLEMLESMNLLEDYETIKNIQELESEEGTDEENSD